MAITDKPRVWNKKMEVVPEDAVYIGRGSKWGNPFVIGRDGDRNDVCNDYENMVMSDKKFIKEIKSTLKGKHLVCFCKPKRCHGDFLLRIANEKT